jgi:hypothetical protein
MGSKDIVLQALLLSNRTIISQVCKNWTCDGCRVRCNECETHQAIDKINAAVAALQMGV